MQSQSRPFSSQKTGSFFPGCRRDRAADCCSWLAAGRTFGRGRRLGPLVGALALVAGIVVLFSFPLFCLGALALRFSSVLTPTRVLK